MENYNINLLKTLENGRFKLILESVNLKEECFNCSYFNENAKSLYRCAVMPQCIGISLSSQLKDFLLIYLK